MKKKMMMMILAVATMACGLTGCGESPETAEANVSKTETVVETEENTVDEEFLEELAALEALEAEIAEEAKADVAAEQLEYVKTESEAVEMTKGETAEAEKVNTETDMAELSGEGEIIVTIVDVPVEGEVVSESVVETLKEQIEKQLDPVKTTLEADWTELTQITDETAATVKALGVKISEASNVEVTDVNLENGTITYKVTAPNMKAMLTKVLEANKGGEPVEVYKDMLLYIGSEELEVVSDDVTVPIETAGRYGYLKLKGADFVDQVTGGFMDTADELVTYVKTMK